MISSNLWGAFDLIMGRAIGLQKLDLTADGFWRSFVGLGLAGVVDAVFIYWLLPFRIKLGEVGSADPFVLVSGMLLVSILAYLGSMTALFFLCRGPDVQSRFPVALIAHNWAAPLVSIVFGPIALVSFWLRAAESSGEPGIASVMIFLTAFSALVFIGIRLLRFSLKITTAHAAALFLGSAAVSIVLETWLSGLLRV